MTEEHIEANVDVPDDARRRPDLTDIDVAALPWRTSSYSNGAGGMCVRIAPVLGGGYVIGDSKDPDGRTLGFSREELAAFFDGVKDGEFDNLI